MTNVAGTDSDAPLVSLKNVSKTFSTNQSELLVVEDFTLNIFEGESIALLGSSGCGKSTLLRMLVGLDTDYKGEILVDGHPVKGIDQERGMVFQEHRLFPWLTVAMNIELGLLNDALTLHKGAQGSRITSSSLAWMVLASVIRISSPEGWPKGWRLPEDL